METDPTGGMAPKRPENQPSSERRMTIPERLQRRDQSVYTVIGEDLVHEIKASVERGDIETLEEQILYAIPLAEGLEHGVEAKSYGILLDEPDLASMTPQERSKAQDADNAVYSRLRNMFLTVEDSVDRGNVSYLREAIADATSRPIRELEEWDSIGGKEKWTTVRLNTLVDYFEEQNSLLLGEGRDTISDEEIQRRIKATLDYELNRREKRMDNIRDNRERLLALDLHVKSRLVIDKAFIQRQYVAGNKDLQAKMQESIGLGAAEPDGTHFHGFYQVYKDWGEAVDRVESAIVDSGEAGFFKKNPTTDKLKDWLKDLAKASEIDGVQRMDVIWAAWRMVCFKELPGKFAADISDRGGFSFDANPPFVGDMSRWLHWMDESRATEFGLSKDQYEALKDGDYKKVNSLPRVGGYKAISHSGHPVGIGKIVSGGKFGMGRRKTTLGNYMEFAVLPDDSPNHAGRSLYEVWRGYEGGEGISMADPSFPWISTELSARAQGTKTVPDEAPQGSVGYWFLQRSRGIGIYNDIKGIPELRAMDASGYVATQRSWGKLGLITPTPEGVEIDNDEGPRNPYFWKMIADLMFYDNKDIGPNLQVAHSSDKERFDPAAAGHPTRGTNPDDYVRNCVRMGLVSEKERQWFGNVFMKKRFT